MSSFKETLPVAGSPRTGRVVLLAFVLNVGITNLLVRAGNRINCTPRAIQ